MAIKNPQYYVMAPNTWGISQSLFEAMKKANALPYIPLTESLMSIESVHYGHVDHLYDWFGDLDQDPEPFGEDRDVKAVTISITDSDLWEFLYANEISGEPSYKWIGEGEVPPLESLTLYLNVKPNGLMTKRDTKKK